jgi:hypothetical protein
MAMSVHKADSDIFKELARQKKIARARLNAMPADVAQKQVSAILRPELWSVQVPASWGQRYAQDIEY